MCSFPQFYFLKGNIKMRILHVIILIASAMMSVHADSAIQNATPNANELKILPLDANIKGEPPASGLRYWSEPFERLPLTGCYVSIVTHPSKDGRMFEIWQNALDNGGYNIVFRRGTSLKTMGDRQSACECKLIDDVPDPKEPSRLAPKRSYTRTAMTFDDKEGYVMAACVCPDYLPGSVSLFPALLVSKTGAPGSFKYLGKLKGEPAAEAAKRLIWSDGGTLLRLGDGRWRYYLNGFGQTLAALESETLEGPWKFIRGNGGEIRELVPDFPMKYGCFPTVLRVSSDNWHLWVTDKWPPQSIWHYWSGDGLKWRKYGIQPEITRAAFGNHGIKCLRPFLDPDSGRIVGLLSVWGTEDGGEQGWILHQSSMPAGAPPEITADK
jgi:hypothetical protein